MSHLGRTSRLRQILPPYSVPLRSFFRALHVRHFCATSVDSIRAATRTHFQTLSLTCLASFPSWAGARKDIIMILILAIKLQNRKLGTDVLLGNSYIITVYHRGTRRIDVKNSLMNRRLSLPPSKYKSVQYEPMRTLLDPTSSSKIACLVFFGGGGADYDSVI